MKILHIIPGIDPSFGGTSTAVVGLAAAQAKAGLDVRVLATTFPGVDGGSNREVLKNAGVTLTSIGPVRGRMQTAPGLRAAVVAAVSACDVVHLHAVWEAMQHHAAVAARKRGVPYVWTPHGMLDPWSLSQRRWIKRLLMVLRTRKDLDRAAALHFTTMAEREAVVPLKLRPASVIEPIGLDLGEVDPRPPPGFLRDRFTSIGDRRITLFLSRLHPKKGLDLLLPAFAKVADAGDVLVLAGPADAAYEQSLRAEAARLSISDRVVFTGMLHGRERYQALADAAVFVLPSHQENFGIVVAEAMAMSVPILISDAVNLAPELLRADAAIVVERTVDAVATAISGIWADPATAVRRASHGRAYVEAWFDWPKIAARWIKHYAMLPCRRAG